MKTQGELAFPGTEVGNHYGNLSRDLLYLDGQNGAPK